MSDLVVVRKLLDDLIVRIQEGCFFDLKIVDEATLKRLLYLQCDLGKIINEVVMAIACLGRLDNKVAIYSTANSKHVHSPFVLVMSNEIQHLVQI